MYPMRFFPCRLLVPEVPFALTVKNLLQKVAKKENFGLSLRRERKGPIIPLWDEEKRLCGIQSHSGNEKLQVIFGLPAAC